MLNRCICPYEISMRSIAYCNFFLNSNSIKYWSIKFWSSFSCVEFWSNMSILKLPIIIMGQEIGIKSKNFWRWIMNIDKDNVEGFYIVIVWITILIFTLNVAVIYLALKDVKVLCDDKLVKLSYIIIVHFLCSFKSSDVLPHFFWKFSWKKRQFFLLGTYARFITTEKESYATINYFIYIHCHPTEEGFTTSFNILFRPFTLIVECVLASMFKDVLLNINVLRCV